jgi:3-dehydroquinate dehydratase
MKNKLSDLHNHLFAELERLSDEETTDEKLIEEINRAKAITNIAEQVIANGNLVLKASVARADSMYNVKIPLILLE